MFFPEENIRSPLPSHPTSYLESSGGPGLCLPKPAPFLPPVFTWEQYEARSLFGQLCLRISSPSRKGHFLEG